MNTTPWLFYYLTKPTQPFSENQMKGVLKYIIFTTVTAALVSLLALVCISILHQGDWIDTNKAMFCSLRTLIPHNPSVEKICDARCVDECADIPHVILERFSALDWCLGGKEAEKDSACWWIEPQAWSGLEIYREIYADVEERRVDYYNFVNVIAMCAYYREKCPSVYAGGSVM